MTDDFDWSEGSEDKNDGSEDRKPVFSFKDIPLPELVLVPLTEALSKLDRMLDLKNKIAVANNKHRPYLSAVGNLAQELLIGYHDHLQKHPMKCRALTYVMVSVLRSWWKLHQVSPTSKLSTRTSSPWQRTLGPGLESTQSGVSLPPWR